VISELSFFEVQGGFAGVWRGRRRAGDEFQAGDASCPGNFPGTAVLENAECRAQGLGVRGFDNG